MREYKTLRKLLAGEIIDFEGIRLKMDSGELTEGDLYIAERNTGPKLLTVKSINYKDGYIIPTTPDYCFDSYECIKVTEVIGDSYQECSSLGYDDC